MCTAVLSLGMLTSSLACGRPLSTVKATSTSNWVTAFPVSDAVVSGPSMLVFGADGRFELRSSSTSAPTPGRLPITAISESAADRDGFLVRGSLITDGGEERSTIVLLDRSGVVRETWQTADLFWSIAADDDRRLATTARGELLQLTPRGRSEKVGDIAPGARLVAVRGGMQLTCSQGARGERGDPLGRCVRSDDTKWSVTGAWHTVPVLCDHFLVADVADGRRGAGWVLRQAWRLSDGTLVGSSAHRRPSKLVCAGAEVVSVEEDGGKFFALPDLSPRATRACGSPSSRALVYLGTAAGLLCLDPGNRLRTTK